MLRFIVRVDGKRRITLPAEWVKPGDYVDTTYIPSEDALVMRKVKPQSDPLKMLKKTQLREEGSKKGRKKTKKNK